MNGFPDSEDSRIPVSRIPGSRVRSINLASAQSIWPPLSQSNWRSFLISYSCFIVFLQIEWITGQTGSNWSNWSNRWVQSTGPRLGSKARVQGSGSRAQVPGLGSRAQVPGSGSRARVQGPRPRYIWHGHPGMHHPGTSPWVHPSLPHR